MSIAYEPAVHERRRDQHQGIGAPDAGDGESLARFGHVDGAQHHRVVDDNDRQKAGDESAQVIALAEPDADWTADESEAQAAQSNRRPLVHLHVDAGNEDVVRFEIVSLVFDVLGNFRLGLGQILSYLMQVDFDLILVPFLYHLGARFE